jgi:hypothetical protein
MCYALHHVLDRFRTHHEHSMRAFYSTQKHVRAFILGTKIGNSGWEPGDNTTASAT